MVGKRADLPMAKLVRVSEAGFSDAARRLAAAKGAVALTPQDVQVRHPDGAVLETLSSLWPKQVTITPKHVQLLVRAAAGETQTLRDVPLAAMLRFDDGEEVGSSDPGFLASEDPQCAESRGEGQLRLCATDAMGHDWATNCPSCFS
jgi:hypothetical protein